MRKQRKDVCVCVSVIDNENAKNKRKGRTVGRSVGQTNGGVFVRVADACFCRQHR